MAVSRTVNNAASIRHLRGFLAVSRHQSFSRAAKELHVSQPALTLAVQQLEDFVGTRLFDRTTRAVTLTPEAVDFLPTAQRLVADFDHVLQDIRAAADSRRGRVAIASVHSIAGHLLPEAIQNMTRRHPSVRVQIFDDNSAAVRRRVRNNEVDVGICSQDDDSELGYRPLFRDQLGLLVRNDHPLACVRRALTWADLEGFDFVGFARDTATPALIRQIQDLPESVANPRFEVSSYPPLWAMVEKGNGITVAAALAAPEAGQAQALRFIALKDPVIWRSVHTVTRRGRRLTTVAEDLLAEVTKLVRRKVGETVQLG